MAENDDSKKQIQIVEIPENTKYWIVRADGGKYTRDFYFNNKISINGENIKLKSVYANYDRFRKYLIDKKENQKKDFSIQSISSKARKIHNFVRNIKKDDIVMTPYKESNEFLIGIVTSDAKLYSKKEIDMLENDRNENVRNYPISKNTLYRNVKWLRVVSRKEIDPSLLYMLRMHQAVISLENNIQHIDKLISPLYIKGENLVLSTQVLKNDGIDSDEWEMLYSSFNKLKLEHQKPEIRLNVQSPGIIDFVMENPVEAGVALVVVVNLIRGGTIKFGNFEVTSFKLVKSDIEKRRENAEVKSIELDNSKKTEEIRTIKIKNDKDSDEILQEKSRLDSKSKVINLAYDNQIKHLEDKPSDIEKFKKITEELKMTVNIDDENKNE